MIEHAFLVQVDQHATVDRIPDSGALNLARLKYDIAVGEDDRLAHGLQVCDRRERVRKDSVGERVLQEELRHVEQVRIVVEPGAKQL
jgi:hypothetical protein